MADRSVIEEEGAAIGERSGVVEGGLSIVKRGKLTALADSA